MMDPVFSGHVNWLVKAIYDGLSFLRTCKLVGQGYI